MPDRTPLTGSGRWNSLTVRETRAANKIEIVTRATNKEIKAINRETRATSRKTKATSRETKATSRETLAIKVAGSEAMMVMGLVPVIRVLHQRKDDLKINQRLVVQTLPARWNKRWQNRQQS